MLEATYPDTVVYDSTRRMLKDHPPDDVRGLGIDPPRDRSRGYRAAAVALWCTVLLPTYGLAAIPREAVSEAMTRWWPLVLIVAIGWQAGMVWLLSRLLSLQSTSPFGTPPRQP
jgi:hypothetical protein